MIEELRDQQSSNFDQLSSTPLGQSTYTFIPTLDDLANADLGNEVRFSDGWVEPVVGQQGRNLRSVNQHTWTPCCRALRYPSGSLQN